MPSLADISPDPVRFAVVLLAIGGAGLYVAARFATHALIGRAAGGASRERSAGGIALGHWLPTVAVCAMALIAGRADLAIAVVFAVSVAALLLALGMTVFLVPSEPLPPTRRVWPFLLPAGLLVVVAGFGSALNLIHALMLAVLGVCVLGVWRSLNDESAGLDRVLNAAEAGSESDASPPATGTIPTTTLVMPTTPGADPAALAGAAGPAAATSPGTPTHPWFSWRALQWSLSAVLAFFAGWLVVRGTLIADVSSHWLRPTILIAGAVSPLLVLPLLAVGTDLAQRNQSGEACSACVGLALLNLLGLLPLLIVGWAVRCVLTDGLPAAGYASVRAGVLQPASAWFMRLPSLPLPLTTWRIDAIVITVVGFALLPAALGRWRLGRIEAVALIAGYAAYLAVSALLSVTSR